MFCAVAFQPEGGDKLCWAAVVTYEDHKSNNYPVLIFS